MNGIRFSVLICSCLLFIFVSSIHSAAQSVRIDDNSDWWSQLSADQPTESIPAQNKEPAESNYSILGVSLGRNDPLQMAFARLGQAQRVNRGDASTGRQQICYASVSDRPRIYLIFERGEVTDSFYFFAGGANWNGSNLCTKSHLVTPSVSVASGLRLGQTLSEVRAILGKPSAVFGNKTLYSFAVEKKTSQKDFDKLRKAHPEANEEELHRDYDVYSLQLDIQARFKASKLIYLAVSETAVY